MSKIGRNAPVEVRHAAYVVGLVDQVSTLLKNCFIENKNFDNLAFYSKNKDLIEQNKMTAGIIKDRVDDAIKEVRDTIDNDNLIIAAARQLLESASSNNIDENGCVMVRAEHLLALAKQMNEVVGDDFFMLDGQDSENESRLG